MGRLLIACGVLTGTLFVLMKDPSPKQQLLEAVSSQGTADEEVQELIKQLQGQSPERRPASSAKSQGKWRLLWSMQVELCTGLVEPDEWCAFMQKSIPSSL